VVSGFVLNFVPKPAPAVAEMVRVVRPGGIVAAYVWDYAGKVQLMGYFRDVARRHQFLTGLLRRVNWSSLVQRRHSQVQESLQSNRSKAKGIAQDLLTDPFVAFSRF
jgi:hypothetical protein